MNDGVIFEPAGHARIERGYGSFEDWVGFVYYEPPTGLPPPEEGVLLIVSKVVAEHTWQREDLVYPAYCHPDCCRNHNKLVSIPGFIKP